MKTQIEFNYSTFNIIKETPCFITIQNVSTDEIVRINKKKDNYKFIQTSDEEVAEQLKIKSMSRIELMKYMLELV
jgi:hypothetical protein